MLGRYLLNFFTLVALVFAPWWIFLCGLIAGAFLFPKYYEILIFAVLYDLVYASQNYTITLVDIVAFLCVTLFRHNFNLHEKKVTRHG